MAINDETLLIGELGITFGDLAIARNDKAFWGTGVKRQRCNENKQKKSIYKE
jgi:hypothetical protein